MAELSIVLTFVPLNYCTFNSPTPGKDTWHIPFFMNLHKKAIKRKGRGQLKVHVMADCLLLKIDFDIYNLEQELYPAPVPFEWHSQLTDILKELDFTYSTYFWFCMKLYKSKPYQLTKVTYSYYYVRFD